MRKIALFGVFLVLFNFFLALAEESFITVRKQVVGYGSTENEAVQNAIIEAIKQVYGFSLEGATTLQTKETEKISGDINLNIQKNSIARVLMEKYKGFVDSYRILQVKKESPDSYKAIVEVYIKKYVPPGLNPDNRRKLAVYPFKVEENHLPLPKQKVEEIFTDTLTNYMVHSRKFTVLERVDKTALNREVMEVASNLADRREIVKLGRRLGADYLLIGKVMEIGIDKKTEGSKALGWYEEKPNLYYYITYKVIAFATGQIKYSNDLIGSTPIQSSKLTTASLAMAIKPIAKQIEEDVVFSIYPPKVIYVEGNRAIINYGNQVLKPNEEFEVYKLGKKLYDPYTHEPLGYEEIKIGKVKIVKSTPKYSIAKIEEGTATVGSILRKVKQTGEVESKQYRKSDIKVQNNGTVKLPWD